ncbi:hypothetical protein, partial [Prevotella histicola]|uniref:hypothetical protein n=1 Tax=Prevotella histicola TaxID=470565 RepID=UPI0028ED430B
FLYYFSVYVNLFKELFLYASSLQAKKTHFVKASAKVYRISFTTKCFGEYFSKSLYFAPQDTTPHTKIKHKSNYKPQDSPYRKTQSKSHPKQ